MPLDMQGTLNLDRGTLSVDASAHFGPSAVVSSNGGTLSIGGDLTVSGSLDTGLATLVLRDGCVSNTTRLQGNLMVHNLTLSSTTGRTFVLPAGANVTVLDRLDIQGVAGANVQVTSAGGTATINLGPGATVTRTFATVSPNVQIGAAPPAVSAAPIPTLGTHAIALLSLLLAGLAVRSRKAG